MKITWFGHSCFRVETGSSVVLIDPFLKGNPTFEGSEVEWDAAHACKTFFHFKTVFPAHYGTFPFIDQTADAFVGEMKGHNVVVPKLGEAVTV